MTRGTVTAYQNYRIKGLVVAGRNDWVALNQRSTTASRAACAGDGGLD